MDDITGRRINKHKMSNLCTSPNTTGKVNHILFNKRHSAYPDVL